MNLTYDKLLSNVAFNFNLRHYSQGFNIPEHQLDDKKLTEY